MKLVFKQAVLFFTSAIVLVSCGTDTVNENKNTADTAVTAADMNNNGMKMPENVMTPMDKMMSGMKTLKASGDFDIDFATTMMLHHQMAIDMSEAYLPKSMDAKIKAMATNIIDAQKKEIEQMKSFLNSYVPGVAEKNYKEDKLKGMMTTMMDKMHAMTMTGNADKDFVMEMIPHHEAAVNMAQEELLLGTQKNLQQMAKKMMTDQSREIQQFKTWLSNTK